MEQNVEEVIKQANQLIEDNKHNEALAKLEQIEQDDNADVLNLLGVIYTKKQDYDKAFEYLDRAIELNTNNAEYYKNKGNVYKLINDYDKAEEFYNVALGINPNSCKTWNNLGNIYQDFKQNYEKAEYYYQKGLSIFPDFYLLHFNIARNFNKKNEKENAIKHMEKALSLTSNPKLIREVGKIYHENFKDYKTAIKLFEQAINIDKNDHYAYNELGIIYKALKIYEKSIENYKKAIEISSNPGYYCNLATIYNEIKDFQSALRLSNKALSELACTNDISISLLQTIISSYIEIEDYEKALTYIIKYLNFNSDIDFAIIALKLICSDSKDKDIPFQAYQLLINLEVDNFNNYQSFINLLIGLGKYDFAINYLKEAINKKPQNAFLYSNLALIYDKKGSQEKAIENYKKSINLNNKNIISYNNLISIYCEMGEFEAALAYANKLKDKMPENSKSHELLGFVYEYLKKIDLAVECYKNALSLDSNNKIAENNLKNILSKKEKVDD